MPYTPIAHRRVFADGRKTFPASVYYGGLLLASGDGAATVAVYDGLDTSGDLIAYFSAVASARDHQELPFGLQLQHGLYIDIGSNVSSFVFFAVDAPEEIS